MAGLDLSKTLKLPELPKYLKQVDQQLLDITKTGNPYIDQPVKRLVQAGGKRLRPSLLIACSLTEDNGINANVIKLACSVELIHLASLVHDDIIDQSQSRWQQPTVNKTEGINRAILVGDFLFSLANRLAAEVSVQAAQLAAQTIINMCDGQSIELADRYDIGRSQRSMYKSIELKTAALMSTACKLGGQLTGMKANKITALQKFGQNFGVSFQLIDDLLDIFSDSGLLGKPVGGDASEGIYTLPIILALKSRESQRVAKLLKQKPSRELANIILSVSLKESLDVIRRYNNRASRSLKAFDNATTRSLSNLPDAYLSWALENLVSKRYRSDILQMQPMPGS